MRKSKINLHIHSNHSLDGCEDVNDILNRCAKEELELVSITDHDSCDCYLDIKDNNYPGKVIYGMEADALVGKVTYDILCYGFDLENVRKWAHKQYGTIGGRQQKIFDKLLELCENLGLKIAGAESYNADKEYAHAALFRMLNETKEGQEYLKSLNVNSVTDLYREGTVNEDFPLYIDMHLVWPSIDEVRDVIHKNGGKIFLAHPFKYGNVKAEDVLEACLPYVDGIEICNEPNDNFQVEYLYDYAKKHNLLISVGSDYHGSNKNGTLLVTDLTDEMEEDILKWTSSY